MEAAGPSHETTYYFAYGSNLHIGQMERRCPNSKYIGLATLANYRWQINQRGYANVVQAEGQCTHGLVFEIDGNDEARLDISEGVSINAYSKKQLSVQLHRASVELYRRPTSWILKNGGPDSIQTSKSSAETKRTSPSPSDVQALVYISLDYTNDDVPREEYVTRMRNGLQDAKALGMDESYIEKCILPVLGGS